MKGLRDLEERVLYVEFLDRSPAKDLVLPPGKYEGLNLISVTRKYSKILVEVGYESFHMPGDERSMEREQMLVHANVNRIIRSKYGDRFTATDNASEEMPREYLKYESPFDA